MQQSGRQLSEVSIKTVFFIIALASITTLLLISLFLFLEGLPVLKSVSLKQFIFGNLWYPTDEPPLFGAFPLIVASGCVTALSALFSVPLGIMTAIYIAEIANKKVAEIVKPTVETLASLPSVVVGLFGMVVVAPFLQRVFNIPVGLNLFNASLMLGFMAVPTICSISEDAINSVPDSLREASLALGATRFETIVKIVLPAGASGIATAVILGMSRAIGETMVVLMVAGGAAIVPYSIFDPVRPMPATIAAEMAEAPFRSEHYHALFAIGIVLFVFTFIFNLTADVLATRFKKKQLGG
ncbi:MAG: phosphate ABC transporter permease subunit PstC [Thermodesulfobacteriota bacterium]|nr:phosphate ABC transporter permease subunit PstC [Thermodesulfobacteriota bacterium]